MPKFSAIVQGARARKRGVECTMLGGAPFTLDLRVIQATDEVRALAYANTKTAETGAKVAETDTVWQFFCAVYVLFLSAVVPESPEDAPEPMFTSPDEILEHLDRDRILLLSEQQRAFQSSATPWASSFSDSKEFVDLVIETAAVEEGGELPLGRLPRPKLELFARSMAVMLSASLMGRSPTGSDTAATGSV